MFKQVSVNGEDFVGMLGLATEKYSVVCRTFKGEEALGVPSLKTSMYGTNLVGMFCKGNSNGLLVPYFMDKEQRALLKKKLKEQKIDIQIAPVDDVYTALGNLIACNDKAAIVSPKFEKSKVFEDTLDVEVIRRNVAGIEEVGSCLLATNKGFLVHPAAEDEISELSKILKVKGKAGTVNFGFPYVGSGLLANSKGYITGMRTTGIELGAIDDALGFF